MSQSFPQNLQLIINLCHVWECVNDLWCNNPTPLHSFNNWTNIVKQPFRAKKKNSEDKIKIAAIKKRLLQGKTKKFCDAISELSALKIIYWQLFKINNRWKLLCGERNDFILLRLNFNQHPWAIFTLRIWVNATLIAHQASSIISNNNSNRWLNHEKTNKGTKRLRSSTKTQDGGKSVAQGNLLRVADVSHSDVSQSLHR